MLDSTVSYAAASMSAYSEEPSGLLRRIEKVFGEKENTCAI